MGIFRKLPFNIALRRAALLARITGKINREEFNSILNVLNNPVKTLDDGSEINLLDELERDVVEQAIVAGELDANSEKVGINWDNLFEFIQKALPVILQLIQLFALL